MRHADLSHGASGSLSRVILRADDVRAATRPADLQAVYGPCWERGVPVCMAVVPGGIRDNAELVALLAEKWRAGMVEIALHGWQHRYGELAGDAVRRRLEAGLAVLQEAWPGVPVRVLVPPHEVLSRAGLQAARRAGLEVCSTWAATHGGTRLAHWWGRFRRWRGLSFAPAGKGIWPTDVSVIDFGGREEEDEPATERLLRLARRWDAPVVFVQHYGGLLDAGGAPNVYHARWLRWLNRVAARPGVRFVRFRDV